MSMYLVKKYESNLKKDKKQVLKQFLKQFMAPSLIFFPKYAPLTP